MNVRAEANQKFLKRFLFISIICFGITAWTLYDGLIGYPKELKRAEAYKALEVEGPQVQSEKWYPLAKENEWNNEIPESPDHVEQLIFYQFVMAAIFTAVGLWLLWWYLRTSKTWIEMDKSGIQASWGPRVEFEEITELNKRRWDKKGIAKVICESNGKAFTLDDFKYDRPNVELIIREIESRLKREQILHGETEAEKDVRKKEKEAATADTEV